MDSAHPSVARNDGLSCGSEHARSACVVRIGRRLLGVRPHPEFAMRKVLCWGLISGVLLLATVASRSNAQQAGDPAEPSTAPSTGVAPEPITGVPVTPRPGSETPPRDPFTPDDDSRPANAVWSYEDLTPVEQAVAHRGLDQPGWQATHDAYRAAVIQRANKAAAAAAEHQLGVDALDTLGVVP